MRRCPFCAKNLLDKVGAAFDAQFFGQDAQAGIRSDEIHGLNPNIALGHQQKLPQEHRSARARGRDDQILRRVIRHSASGEAT